MKAIVLTALMLAAGAASTAGPEPPSFLDKTAAEWAAEIAGCADPADLGNAWCAPGPLPELARGREAALRVIEELLRDVRPGVRALVAAEVLGRMCPKARDLWADPAGNRVARLLLDRLADGAPEVRAAAATGLGTLEFFARESLVIPDHETMAADVPNSCFFEDGPSRDPLMRAAGRRILPLLEDPSPKVRDAAREALHRFPEAGGPPEKEPTVPELLLVMEKEGSYRAEWALGVLGAMGAAAVSAVPDLLALGERRAALWKEILLALGQIGPSAKEALPVVRRLLSEGRLRQRVAAAYALWRISGETTDPLAVLLRALGAASREEEAALLSLVILGRMGPAAAPLVAEIRKFTGAPGPPEYRQFALQAYRRACADREAVMAAHVKALLEAPQFEGLDDHVCITAARGLRILGDPPDEALPGLVRMLGVRLRWAKVMAAATLAAMGPRAAPAVNDLADLLDSNDPAIRREVLRALLAAGDTGVEAIARATGGGPSWVRGEAAGALGMLEVAPPVAQRALLRLLTDPAPYVRVEGAVALVRTG
ncbi:MAG: hypothetical protein MUE73_20130, partial [Planctomycetes bacterium]|nr:hypothetical protein [Planctomycetota bacterium]